MVMDRLNVKPSTADPLQTVSSPAGDISVCQHAPQHREAETLSTCKGQGQERLFPFGPEEKPRVAERRG